MPLNILVVDAMPLNAAGAHCFADFFDVLEDQLQRVNGADFHITVSHTPRINLPTRTHPHPRTHPHAAVSASASKSVWQLRTLGNLTDYVVRDNSRHSRPRMERFSFVDVVFVAGNVRC